MELTSIRRSAFCGEIQWNNTDSESIGLAILTTKERLIDLQQNFLTE